MNSTNEQLQEKKQNLENELKKLNFQLAEVLNLNDNLVLENKEKDDTIGMREQQLLELKDKNSQDIEQLRTERTCSVDYFEHSVEIIADTIKRIGLKRDRYLDLERENFVIKNAIENLKEKMSKDGAIHAQEMHATNAGMRQMRQQMEATFRKELMEMDLAFQQHAFTAMEDHKKRAMLANSKLKDELALQSVGISNLSVRCGRDKQSSKAVNSEMKRIGDKVKAMRKKLSVHQTRKFYLINRIRQVSEELQTMQLKEKELVEEVMIWPDSSLTTGSSDQIEILKKQEELCFKKWSLKNQKLRRLQDDVKLMVPVNESGVGAVNSTSDSDVDAAAVHKLLERVARSDACRRTLNPLLGKESALLSSRGVALCIEQLLDILESEDCDDDEQSVDQGNASVCSLSLDSSLSVLPTRTSKLPLHIEAAVSEARNAKVQSIQRSGVRMKQSSRDTPQSSPCPDKLNPQEKCKNAHNDSTVWIKAQKDELQSYRNLASVVHSMSASSATAGVKRRVKDSVLQVDPPTQLTSDSKVYNMDVVLPCATSTTQTAARGEVTNFSSTTNRKRDPLCAKTLPSRLKSYSHSQLHIRGSTKLKRNVSVPSGHQIG